VSWWVTAAILSKVDFEAFVLVKAAYRLDRFDSVGNIGEVDECTALLAQCVHELDLAILGKVLTKTFFGPGLVQVADVNIT